MDRLSQLRGEAGGSGDSTLDTTSPPSEAYMSANESSSKYFSLSDSTFDITPIKDESLASTSTDTERAITGSDKLLSNMSPIAKKDMLDNYKIGKQIEAANILSGGVDIFDDNDNSFDGNELVIDDNVELDDNADADRGENAEAHVPEEEMEPDIPLSDAEDDIEPASLLIADEDDIEPAPLLIEEVDEDDIEPPPLLIEAEEDMEPDPPLVDAEELERVVPLVAEELEPEPEPEPEPPLGDAEENIEPEVPVVEAAPNIAGREIEVVLQIDGNNVNAIGIGNGLYLYRKDGQQELAAIQILEGDPQHSFKFLKVRDNAEGNLEVYEEIEIEVPKEVPRNEGNPVDNNTPHVPIIDINNVSGPSSINKVAERKYSSPQKEPVASTSRDNYNEEKEATPESKAEVNVNGKMKFNELRKSPVVGCSFTPMTFHSTPNKEGKPLTKTMVDLQLDPNRHSDNVKKTIEVHTDNVKPKSMDSLVKEKDLTENVKSTNAISIVKEVPIDTSGEITNKQETIQLNEGIGNKVNSQIKIDGKASLDANTNVGTTSKCEINTDKEKVATNRLVTGNPSTSSKPSNSNQETSTTELKSDKLKDVVLEEKVVSNHNKESDVVVSKPDDSVVPSQSITKNTTDAATSNTANGSNEKTVISDKSMKENQKSIDLNPLSNNNEDKEKLVNCKNELEKSTVQKDTQLDKEKVITVTNDETNNIQKNNLSDTKQVKPALKLLDEPKLEKPMDSNEYKEVPLETVLNVPSTSTSLRTEESKVECVTPIAMNTTKEYPLIMPSNTIKTKENIGSSKIPEALSDINKTPNENLAIEKQNIQVSTPNAKESSTETNDEVDSTCKTVDIAISFSKSAEKQKNEEESNNQKGKNTEKTMKHSSSVPEVKLSKGKPIENQAGSISGHGVKLLEKTELSVSLPKVKPAEKTAVPMSPVGVKSLEKSAEPVSALGVKSLEKSESSIPVLIVKPAEKPAGFISTLGIKPVAKPVGSFSAVGVKPSEKTVESVPVPEIKRTEKTTLPISAHGVRTSDKTESTVLAPKVKPVEKNIVSTSVLGVKTLEKTELPVPILKAKPSENAAAPILISGLKPQVKTELSIPAPKAKLPKVPHSFVPETSSKKEDNPSALVELNSSEKTQHTKSELNAKSSENLLRIIPVQPSEKTAQLTPLELKPSEKAAVSSHILDVKNSEKSPHSTASPEVKLSENPSNEIIKMAKPVGHIPVVANIANKPSSKHIPILTILKTEGITKSNDNITNPKELTEKNATVAKKLTQLNIESREIKEPISKPNLEAKPVNNNHTAAVPFGKWTDINRQEFLNKFKEVKVPVSTNSKQIKNSNDLNRRDVLKKIDSQRAQTIINNATAKAQEKLNIKNESVFSSKVAPTKSEIQITVKTESADKTPKPAVIKVTAKQENPQTAAVSSTVPSNSTTVANVTKNEPTPRDLSTATMASLIDKTIEDMIHRVVGPSKTAPDESKQSSKANPTEVDSATEIPVSTPQTSKPEIDDSGSLDDIEMKMNELHGIPFVERPPHELPKVPKGEIKTYSKGDKDKPSTKVTKIPNLISSVEPSLVKDNVIDIDSEEELIEHEPITGDIELDKKAIPNKLPAKEKKPHSEKSTASVASKDASNKEDIITETDFDKFARRNSITYENCLTVNFDRKEPHNVVQIVKEKELVSKLNPKTETARIEARSKLPQKQITRQNIHPEKAQGASKFGPVTGNATNKNYQSKIHCAYQSAMTAKQVAHPISIIEDKPVKVVFVESNTGFVASQLNVQGKELSPAKKPDLETTATTNTDFVDSDMLENVDENKQQDKIKTKHQRKQVLTPVEAPDLELIQPSDIGIEVSPKKKRRIEDTKADKQTKNLVHKKSYLLGRNTNTDDKTVSSQVLPKDPPKDITNRNEDVEHKDTASAIDSLVKAAEMLDNESEKSVNNTNTPKSDSQPNTPVKRGRGRPRKYPLPEGARESKTPSPQKKARLIDAKPVKPESISDELNDDSSGEDIMVRENWTMGKINENIVCPICNKLFRSENVVFKHVKHCTGVSPNRSDSDKRSPRRARLSQESEDLDIDYEEIEDKKDTPKKLKSKDSIKTEIKLEQTKSEVEKEDDVIVIEDTPIKEKPEKHDKKTEDEPKKLAKVHNQSNSLVCEFCGKTFRQLSYLVSHKFQHKKEQTNKIEKKAPDSNKSQVFNCEVCKKEFRKLHHLVQHRIIHNPDSVPKRQLRKSSSEQSDTKHVKEETTVKHNEDSSAAFRCEPCDKSFRKLHHLVEHRETHDGINRQKPVAPAQPTVEKPPPPPQCEICKKTFRKLHHLIEHKEQHADTSSEKSDDKSVKSSLSTRDIIHECSLCYMVFPNEHSLTKHSAMCSKKKRQSKLPKNISENESVKEDEQSKTEDKKDEGECVEIPNIVAEEIINDDEKIEKDQDVIIVPEEEKVVQVEKQIINEIKQAEDEKVTPVEVPEKPLQIEIPVKSTEISPPVKRDLPKSDEDNLKDTSVVPEKIKKINHKEHKIQDAPKKKTPLKDKVASTVTKRQKTIDAPPPFEEAKPSVESSDDDEVRYMLNPNYVQVDETTEGKTFMKVRANKRNSLQIERPNSNDLVKRRTSLQHPPKIPRLKPKAVETKLKAAEPKPKAVEPKPKLVESKPKVIETKTMTALKHIAKLSEAEAALSTDSDDSDVKYSFPKVAPETSKPVQKRKSTETKKKNLRKSLAEKLTPKNTGKGARKSLAEKRKSLGGIAKRKSLGKAITAKHKVNDLPPKPIRKRAAEVEHRCDCGQLFTSALLLLRHTSMAHTPPRIRRRRSPPPEPAPKPRKSSQADKTDKKPRKSSVKSDASTSNAKPSAPTRKSGVRAEATPPDTRKSIKQKSESKPSSAKTRRSGAHSGVPVPEKMRKVMKKAWNARVE